jgi:hypothetical protein
MARLLLTFALAGLAWSAAAAPPITEPVRVEVTNAVVPVEVSNADPVLVRDADRSTTEPFQAGTTPSSFSGGSANATLVTVPAGKVLVVEYVSAWINAGAAGGLLATTLRRSSGGSQVAQIVCHPQGQNSLNYIFACAGQTLIRFGPGESVLFTVETMSSTTGFYQVFIAGHYVPAP